MLKTEECKYNCKNKEYCTHQIREGSSISMDKKEHEEQLEIAEFMENELDFDL